MWVFVFYVCGLFLGSDFSLELQWRNTYSVSVCVCVCMYVMFVCCLLVKNLGAAVPSVVSPPSVYCVLPFCGNIYQKDTNTHRTDGKLYTFTTTLPHLFMRCVCVCAVGDTLYRLHSAAVIKNIRMRFSSNKPPNYGRPDRWTSNTPSPKVNRKLFPFNQGAVWRIKCKMHKRVFNWCTISWK